MWLRLWMQLRCDCSQKSTCSFFREVARGCSQSQCRNRCGRGRPAVASLFTVIFTCFGSLIKAIYCLPSYFYLNMSISYITELEWRTKSTSVNKNMTKLWRHWVTDRFCRSHITVVIVNNALTRRRCVRIVRYDTRCYFNLRSKADTSQLNLPHGTNN